MAGARPKEIRKARADVAAATAELPVVAKLSQRVIRKLRQFGYLDPDLKASIVTGYDPLIDDEPELARSRSLDAPLETSPKASEKRYLLS